MSLGAMSDDIIGPADVEQGNLGICVPARADLKWLFSGAAVEYFYQSPCGTRGLGRWILAGVSAIAPISAPCPALGDGDFLWWHIEIDWRYVHESVSIVNALCARVLGSRPLTPNDHSTYFRGCAAPVAESSPDGPFNLRPHVIDDAFAFIDEAFAAHEIGMGDMMYPLYSHNVVAMEHNFQHGDNIVQDGDSIAQEPPQLCLFTTQESEAGDTTYTVVPAEHGFNVPQLHIRVDSLDHSHQWYSLWQHVENLYRLQIGGQYYILFHGNEDDWEHDTRAFRWNAYIPDDYTYLVEIVDWSFRECLYLGRCFAYKVRPVHPALLENYRGAGQDGPSWWIRVATIRQVVDRFTQVRRVGKQRHAQMLMDERKRTSEA